MTTITTPTEEEREAMFDALHDTVSAVRGGTTVNIDLETATRPDVSCIPTDARIDPIGCHDRILIDIRFDRVAHPSRTENVGLTLSNRDGVIHAAASDEYGVETPNVALRGETDRSRLEHYDKVHDITVTRLPDAE